MQRVSIVIPARNEAGALAAVLEAVRRQAVAGCELEVVVVDDGSTDGTAEVGRSAGARVLQGVGPDAPGNPAAARNLGAAAATGDPIVFLDADCEPAPGWLAALLAAHGRGAAIVGGSLELPPGLSMSARCDYYAGWYHVHPRRRAGEVPNHPPGNLSVRRDVFLATSGFEEAGGYGYGHEELRWQAEAARSGHPILFEPRAVAFHHNRPGLGNLVRRSWRWAEHSIEAKSRTGAARMAGLYRWPTTAALTALPLAPVHAGYILLCWVRAGRLEPVLLSPLLLAARVVYSAGMAVGGLRWSLQGRRAGPHPDDAAPSADPPARDRPARDEPVRLTAAVCTRDRPDQLRRALGSLCDLSPPADEILVVDNAPGDDRGRVVAGAFPGVRYVRERQPGLDVARNRALHEASCDVVAFLDDDAVADRDWAGAFRAAFQGDGRLGACTGRVEALSLDHPGQVLFEANGGFGRGSSRVRLPRDAGRALHGLRAPLIAWAVSVGNGSSLALRRELALRIGGFDEDLDRGPDLPGGGDLDLLWRTLQEGADILYEPAALAWHEHRRDVAGAIAQIAGHQRGLLAWLGKAVRRSRGLDRLPVLAFLAWRLFKPGARLLRRAAGRDPLPAPALFHVWRSCWGGLLESRRLRSRPPRESPRPASLPC